MDALYLLGLGWIAGLICFALPYGWGIPLLVGLVGAILSRDNPRLMRTWFCMGLVGVAAWFYLLLRTPRPAPTDVSLQPQLGRGVLVGKVTSSPRTTRSQRQQIWLEAQTWTPQKGEANPVTGKVYVTLNTRPTRPDNPDEEGTEENSTFTLPDLHPSQIVELQGSLYVPRPAQNPGAFDFQRFLRQQGAFAGFSATQVKVRDPGSPYGGWALRRRIRRTLVQALGTEQGELVSSLVMGSRAADLPTEVNDAFREVGLAHVLAASGFHVSILIGVVAALVSRLRARQQQIIIFSVLALYVILTGGSPSVLRATLMGGAAVLAIRDEGSKAQKLNPVALLLLAAVVLLIYEPNWIYDVGFQLSFMATFGLVVGVDPIVRRLPWIPKALATALAVPLAAQFWVFPILLVVFGKINTYFLVSNLLTLPIVTPLIIGGFLVSALALVAPPAALLVAPVLTVLITPLLNIVFWIASWPFTSFYTGGVSWVQAFCLYGVMLALVFWPAWRATVRWYGTFAMMALFLAAPTLLPQPPVAVTILASGQVPVMVVRSQGQTILFNSGDPGAVNNTVLPFLRQQGIRQIDDAISFTFRPEDNAGWEPLHKAIPIRQFWSTDSFQIANATGIDYRVLKEVGESLETAPLVKLKTLATRPLALQMEVPGAEGQPVRWLLAGSLSERQQEFLSRSRVLQPPIDWLWWPGTAVDPKFLTQLELRGGIATGRRIGQAVTRWFSEQQAALYQPSQEGSLRWTAQGMIHLQGDSA
ncbi:MAG: ComEC/Rec2 family competence protein [Thermostichales cyanobacterium DRC_bins_46]